MSAEWYLAELVMKITVADDPRNVVHQDLTLIRASSADEAYEKATKFGKDGETEYWNPDGKAVQISFQGISDLTEVYEDLEDGAELAFRETVGMCEDEIRNLVPSRDRLPAFRPLGRSDGPDYASGEIVAEVECRFGIKRPAK
ncbi:MAG: DUF4288 domain-containing protein [Terracidiphilus sp.]